MIKKTILILFLVLFDTSVQAEPEKLLLAVTTTTENSGLMSILIPAFEQQQNITVDMVVSGSGQALRLGKQGDVDVLLTHSPDDELQFTNSGYGVLRTPVMNNDFILVGPADDPAKVKLAENISHAFENIFAAAHIFVSRGDDSGTHKKELMLWQQNGISPEGEWYVESGQGMSTTLLLSNELQGYTLIDRGTYLAFKDKISLDIHFQGDDVLFNPYHVIAVNPERHQHVNYDLAEKFIAYLVSQDTQKRIDEYKLYGHQLFFSQLKSNSKKDIQQEDEGSGSFFIDASIASLKLILNFDHTLFYVVWTSLKVSLIAVLLATIISLPLGVVVALNNFTGKQFLLACLNTLMALPTVVVGLLLYGLLNRQGLLGEFGLLYTPIAMIIGQCVLITPVIWNLSIAAVNSADPRLAKTCTSLGANHIQRCLIYMSEVRFALIAAVVTGFGRAIGEVGIAMMLGGNINGYTRTMTTAIALETSKGDFEFALALGLILLLVAFIVNVLLQRFQLRVK